MSVTCMVCKKHLPDSEGHMLFFVSAGDTFDAQEIVDAGVAHATAECGVPLDRFIASRNEMRLDFHIRRGDLDRQVKRVKSIYKWTPKAAGTLSLLVKEIKAAWRPIEEVGS